FITSLCMATMGMAQAPQTLVFHWLNQPCSEMLNCTLGCSACNLPSGGSSLLFGTNMAWIGVSTCPTPIQPGDNAIMTTGWPVEVTEDHYIIFSGIAATTMSIDSLVINHTSATNGPTRLKIEFSPDAAQGFVEVADVVVPPSFEDQIFVNIGEVIVPTGAQMGAFQFRITPYNGFGQGWAINDLRVVATPEQQSSVGIQEFYNTRTSGSAGTWYDVMGRSTSNSTGASPAPGVYVGPTKRVRVF
ncbi:MAG TPA: hypothetical protein PK760_13315, partial [Flavobacteriales bacterium]|nr:hypothetical protein [Flavobacteriales bacterium]